MNPIAALEAILFVSDKPVSIETLSELLGADADAIRGWLQELGQRYDGSSAIQLVQLAGGYQLSTRSEFADLVARFLAPAKQRLSRSVMEVLAIVAYRQPVTVAEIEAVRGVQSDYGLRQLLDRRLVREVGRKNTPGRPVLYGTTQQFLHQFKMVTLDDLPELSIEQATDQPALDMRVPIGPGD